LCEEWKYAVLHNYPVQFNAQPLSLLYKVGLKMETEYFLWAFNNQIVSISFSSLLSSLWWQSVALLVQSSEDELSSPS
jgi:hypothetical protein